VSIKGDMQLDIKGSVVFRHITYPDCEKCEEGAELMRERGIRFATITCDKSLFGALMAETKSQDVPQFFVKGKYIGGLTELKAHLETL
tara:strand:+ start:145332 stop:145595 length:264 start_codon:yes stop_codon:yes gene_type:complete